MKSHKRISAKSEKFWNSVLQPKKNIRFRFVNASNLLLGIVGNPQNFLSKESWSQFVLFPEFLEKKPKIVKNFQLSWNFFGLVQCFFINLQKVYLNAENFWIIYWECRDCNKICFKSIFFPETASLGTQYTDLPIQIAEFIQKPKKCFVPCREVMKQWISHEQHLFPKKAPLDL